MTTRTDVNETYEGNVVVRREVVTVDTTAETSEATLRSRAGDALADLRLIANSTGTLTGAQLSNAVRTLARVAIAVVRLHLRRLDGTD